MSRLQRSLKVVLAMDLYFCFPTINLLCQAPNDLKRWISDNTLLLFGCSTDTQISTVVAICKPYPDTGEAVTSTQLAYVLWVA